MRGGGASARPRAWAASSGASAAASAAAGTGSFGAGLSQRTAWLSKYRWWIVADIRGLPAVHEAGASDVSFYQCTVFEAWTVDGDRNAWKELGKVIGAHQL